MAPKVALRRPAARAGGLRRPAARGDDEPGAAAEVPPRILGQLTLQELQKLGNVRLRDAKYYGKGSAGCWTHVWNPSWRWSALCRVGGNRNARWWAPPCPEWGAGKEVEYPPVQRRLCRDPHWPVAHSWTVRGGGWPQGRAVAHKLGGRSGRPWSRNSRWDDPTSGTSGKGQRKKKVMTRRSSPRKKRRKDVVRSWLGKRGDLPRLPRSKQQALKSDRRTLKPSTRLRVWIWTLLGGGKSWNEQSVWARPRRRRRKALLQVEVAVPPQHRPVPLRVAILAFLEKTLSWQRFGKGVQEL